MRFFYVAIISVMLSASLFGEASPKLSLSEKIALAKHMADEAAEGKAESGRVVDGNFDFVKAVADFRALQIEKARQAEEAAVSLEKESDRRITMDEIDESPLKSADKTSQIVQISPPESFPKIDIGVGKEAEKEIQKSVKKSSQKFAVDIEGDDFINGYFVGKLDGKETEKEIQERTALKNAIIKDGKYFNYSGSVFYVVSDDYDALSTTISFVRECEDMFNYYFAPSDGKVAFVRKITLYIVSGKTEDMKSRFVISHSGTDTTIAAKWDETLEFSDFCKLLSGAFLRKIYTEERGADRKESESPYWLELAMSISLEQRLRFGVAADCARIASEHYSGDFSAAVSLPRTRKDRIAETLSYWTFKALEKASPNREAFRTFLYALPMAKSPEDVKNYAISNFPYLGRKGDFNMLWNCVLMGEIWSRINAGIFSPEMSEEDVLRYAVIQADTSDGGRMGISDSKIWSQREFIRREIELRVLEIKIALPRANPVYHNSMLALGKVFEAALDDDEDAFSSSYSEFMSEFRAAKKIAELVKNKMSKNMGDSDKTLDSSEEKNNL